MAALATPTNRVRTRTMRLLSGGDTTTSATVSPFWGSLKMPVVYLRHVGVTPLIVYAMALSAGAFGLLLALVAHGDNYEGNVLVLVGLCALAALAERQGVQVGLHTHTSISVLPILFAAVVFGPLAGMIVGFAALLPYFGRPALRWMVWTSSRMILAGLAGLVASLFLHGHPGFPRILLAVAAAAAVEGVGDALLTSGTVGLRHEGAFGQTLQVLTRVLLVTAPLYTPIVAALAYAYTELSPWTLVFFTLPAIAAHRLLLLYQEQRLLMDDLVAANHRLEQASVSFSAALVAALDARDPYTAGHSAAVAVYARDIARELDLPAEDQQRAHLAGLLHDIGKVGLPSGLLEKVGSLSPAERRQMERHSEIGERILGNVDEYADIAQIVRHHHERLDGDGYPDGLSGRTIPLLARILAVADAYSAMTSGRPYRAALDASEARRRLRMDSGSQFDPIVVAAFERLLAAAGETYLVANRSDFGVAAQWLPWTPTIQAEPASAAA
jgi:putative nucleotidyltransferase with HDIG domain